MADKNVQVEEFTKELDKILADYIHSSFEQRQKVLKFLKVLLKMPRRRIQAVWLNLGR